MCFSKVLSRFRVTTERSWINNWIYCTILQRVMTLHTSLSRTDQCPTSGCLVAASNDGRSSASGLTSLQGGDHLTPISYSDHWLQPVLPSPARFRAELTSNCQTPASAVKVKVMLDRRSVGQSVKVSSTHVGPMSRFLLLSNS
jgi:hypothetical protein